MDYKEKRDTSRGLTIISIIILIVGIILVLTTGVHNILWEIIIFVSLSLFCFLTGMIIIHMDYFLSSELSGFHRFFKIVFAVILSIYIAVLFISYHNQISGEKIVNNLIVSGDELFISGDINEARMKYEEALTIQENIKIPSEEMACKIYFRLSLIEHELSEGLEDMLEYLKLGIKINPELSYDYFTELSKSLGVELSKDDQILFGKVKFIVTLESKLKESSPLDKSQINISLTGDFKIVINIIYNQEDLEPEEESAQTEYNTIEDFKEDVIKTIVEIVQTIHSFTKEKGNTKDMKCVDIACKHGIKTKNGFLGIGDSEDSIIIYAIHIDYLHLMEYEKPSTKDITSRWEVTEDRFHELDINLDYSIF